MSLKAAILCALLFAVSAEAAKPVIADLKTFPQDPAAYMPSDPDAPIVSRDRQELLALEMLERRSAPWRSEGLEYLDLDIGMVISWMRGVADKEYFGADGKRFPRAELARIAANGAVDPASAYPRPGISLIAQDVRILPTAAPLYSSAASARGERGLLRQDALQASTLKPGEPLSIWASSLDSKWLYVATDSVVGWIRANGAAVVGAELMAEIDRADHAVAIRDDIKVHTSAGEVTIKLGALLPMRDGRPMLPIRGRSGFAELVAFDAPDGSFAPFPVPFTARGAIRAIGEMIGERYGWGGSGGTRDCSAMTRDYFAQFGVWIPRNSGDQCKTGEVIPTDGLPAASREKFVAEKAIPFATLAHIPGHIMLYIGTKGGRPVFFHNMWGIRIKGPQGKQARVPVGAAVITSLRAGEEIKGRPANSLFVNRLDCINIPSAKEIDTMEMSER